MTIQIFFPEYMIHDGTGSEVIPFVEDGMWFLGEDWLVSLTYLADRCKIDDEELIMLRLTYGG